MGIVADYLKKQIAAQVDDSGIVVWYDPEGVYSEIARSFQIPDTTIAIYEGSFFKLRYQIRELMLGLEPPRLVVYIPLAQEKTHYALIELEAAGVVMKPGQQPVTRNTRLAVVARNAAKQTGKCTDEWADQLVRDIEAGKYSSIDEIEQVIGRPGPTIIQLIFGTVDPDEIALQFLSNKKLDTKLQEKKALPELMQLMESVYGTESDAQSLEDYRTDLSRWLLATEFTSSITGDIPTRLKSVKSTDVPEKRKASSELVNNWRMRRDLRESYAEHSKKVEDGLGISGSDLNLHQIKSVETFHETERILQQLVESAMLKQAEQELVDLANQRKSGFWAEYRPDVQAQWALIEATGQVIVESNRIEREVKAITTDAKTMFEAYTGGEKPWCLFDTYHRRMERRYNEFDFRDEQSHHLLQQLAAKARQRYTEVGSSLSEKFIKSYQAAKFQISSTLLQRDIYDTVVKPKLADSKVAYVWVDALRFEMARELVQTLYDEFDIDVQPAVATVPTITEIGMASLLPKANQEPAVEPAGEGKLGFRLDGTILKDRAGRVKFLKDNAGVDTCDMKLEDLLPNPKNKIKESIGKAQLVLVTSQEIDALAEGDNVFLARRFMDDILHELQRAIRKLDDLGIQVIVITADHGYLFGEEQGDEMKIDPPGGETIDLHRRVWIGKGGASDPAYMRAKLSEFGLNSNLDIATPWNFAIFKSPGARAYFHGGLSLQELAVSVVTLVSKKKAPVYAASEIEWVLMPGSEKLTTRFISVQVGGKSAGLFDIVPPKVRIEVRDKGQVISSPVSASYGFEDATRDVQLKLASDDPKIIETNVVTLMLMQEPLQKKVSIHILDAVSGVELAQLPKIEVAIQEY